MKSDAWRIVYGYLLLGGICVLAARIALGVVEEKSSYGLSPLLIILTLLADRWASWAFPRKGDNGGEK